MGYIYVSRLLFYIKLCSTMIDGFELGFRNRGKYSLAYLVICVIARLLMYINSVISAVI